MIMTNNDEGENQTNQEDIDLTFIPCHIPKKLLTNDKRVLNNYKRILKRGRLSSSHFKCLQTTMKPLCSNTDNQEDGHATKMTLLERSEGRLDMQGLASTNIFKQVVELRSFDDFGRPLRGKRIPHSGEEVIVRKSILRNMT